MEMSPKFNTFYKTTGFKSATMQSNSNTLSSPFSKNKSLRMTDPEKLDLSKVFQTLQVNTPEHITEIDWSNNYQMIPLGQENRFTAKPPETKQDFFHKSARSELYNQYKHIRLNTDSDLKDKSQISLYTEKERDFQTTNYPPPMLSVPRNLVKTPHLSHDPSLKQLRPTSSGYSLYSGWSQRVNSASTISLSRVEKTKEILISSKPRATQEEIRNTVKGSRKHRATGSLAKFPRSNSKSEQETNKFLKQQQQQRFTVDTAHTVKTAETGKTHGRSMARILNRFVNQSITEAPLPQPRFSTHGSGLRIKKLPELLYLKTDYK